MYAMVGKLNAKHGQREVLVKILLRAANLVSQLPECKVYAVHEEALDEQGVWVYELWLDKRSHDDSLKLSGVRELIGLAIPLLDGDPQGYQLQYLGGHGFGNLSA